MYHILPFISPHQNVLAQNQISILSKSLRNLNLGRNFRKMPNLVESLENLDLYFEIFENRDFCRNFGKVSILARMFENSFFWSQFSKNLNCSRNLRKIAILVEISKNPGLGRNFRLIAILLEIFKKNSLFWWNFFLNHEFDRNFRKCRFGSKFFENFILVKIFESFNFGQNSQKKSILINIS